MERRLSAILASDVAGYSRLMGIDEIGTLRALNELRSEVIDPFISQFGGRIVKLTGDGILAEFHSVVDALDCAAKIQENLFARNATVDPAKRIELRIGINLSDVIVQDGDLFGDGVNIAARIEGLAPVGGIAVTEWIRDSIGNKLEYSFEDRGVQSLKNISRPVRVYTVLLGHSTSSQARPIIDNKQRAKSASLAVLPFATVGNAADQDYFAEGVSEDILTELSRFRSLLVIARNSSFSFKGREVAPLEIAAALGVEYLVTGNVRRSGNRVRVTVQLTQASSGHEVWAERYDRELTHIFDVQDDIVRTVAVTLEARLGLAVANHAATRSVPSLAAYECILLAKKHAEKHDGESALPLAERALSLDPGSSQAHIMISAANYTLWLKQPSDERLEKMADAARAAVVLDSSDANAHAYLGMALTLQKDFDAAGSHLQRALSLNPGSTRALAYHAEWLLRTGDGNGALRALDEALLRDPIPPPWHWEVRGLILLVLERYDEAVRAFARQSEQFWYIPAYLAVCFAKLGRMDEARKELAKALKTIPDPKDVRFYLVDEIQSPLYRAVMADGLTLGGLA